MNYFYHGGRGRHREKLQNIDFIFVDTKGLVISQAKDRQIRGGGDAFQGIVVMLSFPMRHND
jgi:hypothetical protein